MPEPQLSNFEAALAEQAAEEARLAIAALTGRRDQLLDALGKVDVRDDEDMRRAIDKIVLAKACRDAADAALQPIATPYRDAVHSVNVVAKGFVDPLLNAERAAQQSIDAFRGRQREAAANSANEQRRREAELRRQAGLESQQTAPVKAGEIKLGSARSDYRGQVFDRKVLKIEITDPRMLPDDVLNAPFVIEALKRAVRTMAALTRNIPGATIEDDQKSTVKAG